MVPFKKRKLFMYSPSKWFVKHYEPVYTWPPGRARWFRCRNKRREEQFPCQVRQSHRRLRKPDEAIHLQIYVLYFYEALISVVG